MFYAAVMYKLWTVSRDIYFIFPEAIPSEPLFIYVNPLHWNMVLISRRFSHEYKLFQDICVRKIHY